MDQKNLSPVERIKMASDGLRGTLRESLQNEITGAVSEDDQSIIKFHGIYQQDDRDRREERVEKKLERLYSFMIRLRLPGGALTAEQWIALHHIAGAWSTGIIKITTRQTLQLHGLVKSKLKPTIQAFNQAHLDSIATCGDIDRNVMCSAHPKQSPLHAQVFAYADKISALLMPKTRAYYEIWLDEEKLVDKKQEADPLYQDRYLPRKFKIGIAIPPNNDIDVFANDLGLIAIIENGVLQGFNISVGGGLSTTHGNAETYARLGTVIGFVAGDDKLYKTIYEILTVQRDFGNRSDRKLARLKYTLDRMGVAAFKAEVEGRTGFAMEPARAYAFTARTDYYGWHPGTDGRSHYTVFVENGRILDDDAMQLKTALLEVAETGKVGFQFTGNQNLMVSDVAPEDKEIIDGILKKFGVVQHTDAASALRKNAIACVALPTCPLALAEGQRFMPGLISKVEPLLQKHGLQNEDIIMRLTGCPNGCGRPYVAEIGFVGTGPGHYNMLIGGDNPGERLNTIYRESLDEENILAELDGLFKIFASERLPAEGFGDFAQRRFIEPNVMHAAQSPLA